MPGRLAAMVMAVGAVLCLVLVSGTGPAAAAGAGARLRVEGRTAGSGPLADTQIDSLSCVSAGGCLAAGSSAFGNPAVELPFVITQSDGSWGPAEQVPGLGHGAEIQALSCGSPGSCVVAGLYPGSTDFVAGERHGVWGTAMQIPGLASLTKSGFEGVDAVSCPSAGNCAVAGTDDMQASLDMGLYAEQVFVVDQRDGRWGEAQAVRGLARYPDARIESVSCASAGNCSAAGDLGVRYGGLAFVVTERHGVWGKARQIAGLVRLGASGDAWVYAVSCGSPGNCSADGGYNRVDGNAYGFVADQRHGVWGSAMPIPGVSELDAVSGPVFGPLSCGSAGNCSAVGGDRGPRGKQRLFVVSQVHGRWQHARPVPGLAAINTQSNATMAAMSCTSAGNCSAGGSYVIDFNSYPFVVSQAKGTWGRATKIPGLAALTETGYGQILSLSCGSAGNCSAGGYYQTTGLNNYAFVVSEADGHWHLAHQVALHIGDGS